MVQNKKHILIICPFVRPNIGGVESHITKLVNYTVSQNYYVTVLTYQPLTVKLKGDPLEKHSNYEIHRVRWFGNGWFNKLEQYFPLSFAYLFPGLFIKSLFFYLNHHNKIDCIHAHGLASSVIALILKKLRNKRIIVSTHAVYNFQSRWLLNAIIKVVLSNFDVILAVSEVSKRELIKMGLDGGKIRVHPNWIETDKFKIIDRNKAKGYCNIKNKINFLFLGRLIESKGILLFLEAAKHYPHYGFHVVGTGTLSEVVKQYVSENRNINYFGLLNQEDQKDFEKILSLYNLCDYTISPYLYDEGFSSTLIESVACGTKVIIPERGSPVTFLNKDVAMFLNEKITSNDLIDFIADIDARIRYDRNIVREFAIKNFGENNAKIITDSYDK